PRSAPCAWSPSARRPPSARDRPSCPCPTPPRGRPACAGGGCPGPARGCVARSAAGGRPARDSSLLPHLDEVAHGVQHATGLLAVLDLDGVADPPQPQRAQRLDLFAVGPVARAPLSDSQGAHPAGASSAVAAAGSSAAAEAAASAPGADACSTCGALGCSPSGPRSAAPLPPRPSTSLIDRPRSFATSSGVRSPRRPSTVAFTRLIGFCVPRLLERMSWMPASSSTARTPPPAITPVPGEAGLSSTRPAPKMPVVWWVIVLP